jgi:KaiC/GvpD/RAD55 family RecA-like ATPase
VLLTIFDNDGYNNSFSEILTVVVRDVTVLSVSPSATEVQAGQQVNVTVVVKNNGAITETFNVTVYCNNTKLETQSVADLAPNAEATLTFTWNTVGLNEGAIYTIRAEISQIPGEANTTDNSFTSGVVRISQSPSGPSTPSGFWDTLLPYALPIGAGAGIASILLLAAITVLRKPSEQVGSPVEVTSTGLNPLLDMMGGELPESYSVMIIGGTSAGKSILCQQLTYRYLNQGKPCIYVTYDCFPNEIRESMKNFGWDISQHEENENFTFVDCYSSIAGRQSQEKYSVKQSFALSELGIVMSSAMSTLRQKSARVFFDSTTPLFTRVEPSKIVEFLQDRSAKIKGENGLFFFIVGKGTIQQDMLRRLEEIVDCIIDLEGYEEKGKTLRKMCIKKLRGRKFSNEWVSFKIDMKRGFVLSVPKRSSKKP